MTTSREKSADDSAAVKASAATSTGSILSTLDRTATSNGRSNTAPAKIELVPVIPTRLPKRAKLKSNYVTSKKPLPSKGTHEMEIIDSKKSQRSTYLKHNPSPLAELESFIGSAYQLLVPENVPSTRVFYDDTINYECIGVGSKEIIDFNPIKNDPLTTQDTIIAYQEGSTDTSKENLWTIYYSLENFLNELIAIQDRDPDKNESYFSYYYKSTKEWFNSKIEPNSASATSLALKSYRDDKNKFDQAKLYDVAKLLLAREKHIQPRVKYNVDDPYSKEFVLLENAKRMINKLNQNIDEYKASPGIDILKFEEIIKRLTAEGIEIDKENSKTSITRTIDGTPFTVLIEALKNYLTMKSMANILVSRYYFMDPDGHRNNMSKRMLLDMDEGLWPLMQKFKKDNPAVSWYKSTGAYNPFVITEYDILHFPNLRDANFRHWPNRDFMINRSTFDKMKPTTDNDHQKSVDDSQVFWNTETNVVFEFHKYKSFLKAILLPKNAIVALAELDIGNDCTYTDPATGKVENLLVNVLKVMDKRQNELHDVLIKMPAFGNFLAAHGNDAMKLIKEEMLAYKNKFASKVEQKPHYQVLADSISEEKIDEAYKLIFSTTIKNLEKQGKDQAVISEAFDHLTLRKTLSK